MTISHLPPGNPRAIGNARPGGARWWCAPIVALAMLMLVSGCDRKAVQNADGGCPPESSPFLPSDSAVAGARITYCEAGDGTQATITTPAYPARAKSIRIMVAGYPNHAGITSTIEGVNSGQRIEIELPRAAESWVPAEVQVPQALQNEPVRIVLRDETGDFGGWAGLGFAAPPTPGGIASGLLPILLAMLAAHLWCATVASLLPASLDRWARAFVSILVLGAAGFATFWLWLASPALGVVASWAILAAPFAGAAAPKFRPAFSTWLTANRTILPALVLALLALWIGLFPFSWQGESWVLPANRWSGLPVDNWLPFLFAEMVASGTLKSPMIGSWLSSDRPPLQTGIYLLFEPLGFSPGRWYQGLASWLQALVMVPLCWLMADSVPSRRSRVLALTVLALAPLTLLNTLFVWPKLLAATYCLIYHFILFRSERTVDARTACLAGLAASLAMLAHGGALFALIGSTLAFVALRPKAAFGDLRYVAPVALLSYLPWVLYQRLIDPPGDRLVKWHFAGHADVTDQSLMQTLRDAYAAKPPAEWWSDRLANLDHMATGTLNFFHAVLRLVDAIGMSPHSYAAAWNSVYAGSFYHFSYALWYFGPVAMGASLVVIALRRRAFPRHVAALSLAVALSLLSWAFLMFEPRSAIIHQGAYSTVLAAIAVGILLVHGAAPRIFQILAVLSIATSLAIYAFDPRSAMLQHYATYAAGVLVLLGSLAAAADRSTSRRLNGEGIDQ